MGRVEKEGGRDLGVDLTQRQKLGGGRKGGNRKREGGGEGGREGWREGRHISRGSETLTPSPSALSHPLTHSLTHPLTSLSPLTETYMYLAQDQACKPEDSAAPALLIAGVQLSLRITR